MFPLYCCAIKLYFCFLCNVQRILKAVSLLNLQSGSEAFYFETTHIILWLKIYSPNLGLFDIIISSNKLINNIRSNNNFKIPNSACVGRHTFHGGISQLNQNYTLTCWTTTHWIGSHRVPKHILWTYLGKVPNSSLLSSYKYIFQVLIPPKASLAVTSLLSCSRSSFCYNNAGNLAVTHNGYFFAGTQ